MRPGVPATTHAAHNDTTSQRRVDRDEGRDAATGRDVELLTSGIVEPTKAVRIARETAVCFASLLLIEATLTEVPVERRGPKATLGQS